MKDNVTARCWAGRRSNECLFQPPWIFIFLWSRSWSRGRRWMLYTDWKYFIAASSSASLSTPELPPRPGHPYLIQLREEEKVFANTQRPRRRPELKEAYKIHRLIWLQVLALLWYWDWEEEKLLWHHEKLRVYDGRFVFRGQRLSILDLGLYIPYWETCSSSLCMLAPLNRAYLYFRWS